MKKSQHFRKSYRVKRKKSIFKNRFFWVGVLVLVISIGASYLVCFWDFFQIEKIEISGNQKVNTENIKNLIEKEISKKILFFPTKSIFLANLENARENLLEKFPQIDEINLEREFPRNIKVEVVERKPVAVFVFTKSAAQIEQVEEFEQLEQFYIDKEGIIYEKISKDISENIFEIRNTGLNKELKLGEQVIEKEKLAQILEIERNLKQDIKIQIKSAEIVSEQRLNIKTLEGWEIYFNTQRDIDWQITELDLVLKEKIPPDKRGELEYIDLRFDKVYLFPDFSQLM